MSGNVTIYAISGQKESLELPVFTDSDPTGTAPAFAVAAQGSNSPTGFADGTWSGSYDSTHGSTTARTPTIGATGATLVVTAGTTYTLWAKITLGGEVAYRKAGTIEVPA